MLWFITVILTLLVVVEAVLLVRATKRLLQFDEIFERIVSQLADYVDDLTKMSSTGTVLLEHPEVAKFHNRNLLTIKQVMEAVEDIRKTRPEEPKTPLPRPEAE